MHSRWSPEKEIDGRLDPLEEVSSRLDYVSLFVLFDMLIKKLKKSGTMNVHEDH